MCAGSGRSCPQQLHQDVCVPVSRRDVGCGPPGGLVHHHARASSVLQQQPYDGGTASAGGVPVMAHPGYTDDLENVLTGLVAAGLKGMEVHYAQYDEKARAELAEIAERYGLIPCGGTDYHATDVEGEHLPGEIGPPMETVERLKALAGG